MNLEKAKKLLDKINSLYAGMEDDGDDIAQIEKDLMRSYVRQFYDIFLEKESTKADTTVAARAPKQEKINVPPAVSKPAPPVHEPPRVIELPEDVQDFVEEAKAAEPLTPPPVVPQKVTPPPAPSPEPPQAASAPLMTESDEEVLELFKEKKASDLSEKLSSMPVTDLMKTMGLNERILTVNELFDGDANAFKKVMTDLNLLGTFDEAKDYLAANVVGQYGWTRKSKKGKAKVLIKTIRRRYA